GRGRSSGGAMSGTTPGTAWNSSRPARSQRSPADHLPPTGDGPHSRACGHAKESRTGAPRGFATPRRPARGREEPDGALILDGHHSEWPPARRELLLRSAGCDGLMTMLSDRIDDELLDAAGPRLRIIANFAVGFDNIDVPACTRRGVIVSNTPDVLTEATA